MLTILKPFYDPAKLKQVIATAWEFMSSSNIYGLTFYITIGGLLFMLIANLALGFGKKENKEPWKIFTKAFRLAKNRRKSST